MYNTRTRICTHAHTSAQACVPRRRSFPDWHPLPWGKGTKGCTGRRDTQTRTLKRQNACTTSSACMPSSDTFMATPSCTSVITPGFITAAQHQHAQRQTNKTKATTNLPTAHGTSPPARWCKHTTRACFPRRPSGLCSLRPVHVQPTHTAVESSLLVICAHGENSTQDTHLDQLTANASLSFVRCNVQRGVFVLVDCIAVCPHPKQRVRCGLKSYHRMQTRAKRKGDRCLHGSIEQTQAHTRTHTHAHTHTSTRTHTRTHAH